MRPVLDALAALGGAFVIALFCVAGATKWLPVGAAGVDHVVVPIVFFPLLWIGLALALHGARDRRRAWALGGALAVANVAVLAGGLLL